MNWDLLLTALTYCVAVAAGIVGFIGALIIGMIIVTLIVQMLVELF